MASATKVSPIQPVIPRTAVGTSATAVTATKAVLPYSGFTSMLRNGICESVCNNPECLFDDADCLSESIPFTVYVSPLKRPEEIGSFASPYSSVHKALIDIWAPYTQIWLLNGTHNITLFPGSTSTNPLNKGSSSRVMGISIGSLLCGNSSRDHVECATTAATLQLSRDLIKLSVYGKMSICDVAIRGDFDLLPGCWSSTCTYCPYTSYDATKQTYYNDRGEVVDISTVANQTYCSPWSRFTLIDMQTNATFIARNVRFLNIRFQPQSLIASTCGTISLQNVDFRSCQGRGTNNGALLQLASRTGVICGSFEYVNGTVSLLNNGYEHREGIQMSGFLSTSNVSKVLIQGVVFRDNVMLGGVSGGFNRNQGGQGNQGNQGGGGFTFISASLITFSVVDSLLICNTTFLRNIVTSGSLLFLQADYTFPVILSPTNTSFVGRDIPHIVLAGLRFELNAVNLSLVSIGFTKDQQNVKVSDCTFLTNFADNGSILAVWNTALTQEAKTGVALDVALSQGTIVSVFSPPRYLTFENLTFTGNRAVATSNVTNIGQLWLRNVTYSRNGQSGFNQTIATVVFPEYMQQSRVYMKAIPVFNPPSPCKYILPAMNVYNVSISDANFTYAYCPLGYSGLVLSGDTEVLTLQRIALMHNIGFSVILLRINVSVSLSAVNVTNNTDISMLNSVSLGVTFATVAEFMWEESIIANNSGGSGVTVSNARKTTLNKVCFINNTAKLGSPGVTIAVISSQSSEISIYRSRFSSNSANEGGLILVTNPSNSLAAGIAIHFNLTTCVFDGNKGKLLGTGLTIADFLPLSNSSIIENVTFTGNSNGEMGAGVAVSIRSGSLTVTNCTFRNNTAKRGDAIYSNSRAASFIHFSGCNFSLNFGGSVITVIGASDFPAITSENLLFSNNFATSIDITQSKWTDSHSQFLNNTATSGVVLKAFSQSVVFLSYCVARMNRSVKSAGVLYVTSGSLAAVSNCVFSDNLAMTVGGVVFVDQSSRFQARSSVFLRNSAKEKGAVIYQLYSETDLWEVTMEDNAAGMYSTLFLSDSTLIVRDSTLRRNIANGATPGISALQSNVSIRNLTFGQQYGDTGAMLLADQSEISIADSDFEQCSAQSSGGCIYGSFSHITVTDSRVTSVVADSGGFAYVTKESNLTIIKVRFDSVVSRVNEGGIRVVKSTANIILSAFNDCSGGCISVTSSRTAIDSCEFRNGAGTSGAAVATENSDNVVIRNSVFMENRGQYGGAVACIGDRGNAMSIEGSTFESNQAEVGGAVYTTSCNVTLIRNDFSENRAVSQSKSAGRGGAIFANCNKIPFCACLFTANRFDSNFASLSGGALAWEDTEPELSNNEFVENEAKYGENIASHAIKIAPVDKSGKFKGFLNGTEAIPTAFFIENLRSGALYDGVMRLGLFDHKNQLLTTDSYSAAEIVIRNDNNLTVFGDIKAIANNGIFTFTRFTITGRPGSMQEFQITTPALRIATMSLMDKSMIIDAVAIRVSFRECLMGEHRNGDKCEECPMGTYSFDPTQPCAACPDGAICYGNYTMVPDKGYWRADVYSAVFFPCNNPDACIGSLPYPYLSFEGECANGYEGNLCDSCKLNHSKTGKNVCAECPSLAINLILTGSILAAALIVLGVVIYVAIRSANRPNSELAIYMKILMNYAQMVIIAASLNMRWPSYTSQFLNAQLMIGNAAEQVFSVDCIIQEVYSEHIFYSKIIVTSMLPVALMLLSVFVWFLLRVFKPISLFPEKLMSTFVSILFLLHTSITKIEFSMFACQELRPGELWLAHDMQQQCWSPNHVRYILAVAIPSIILWVIGLPLLCLAVLVRRRLILANGRFQMMFSFLYRGYVRKRYYWEFVILYRKVCLVSSLVFLAPVSVAVQAQTVLAVLLVSSMLQISVDPFNIRVMNTLEVKSIFVSAITIYCGLYYESNAMSKG